MEKRVVFITGASRGIGAATVKKFADNGWKVAGFYKRNKIENTGSVKYHQMDVADVESINKAFEQAFSDFGRVDCLVNCAGTITRKPFFELDEGDWIRDYRVNMLGTVFASRWVVSKMNEGSSIVNVSSLRGFIPTISERAMPYTVTKAGIKYFTAALAKEVGLKIRVNAVAPGLTDTDMLDKNNEKLMTRLQSSLPARPATPEEIANVIYFLGCSESSYVTGQTILVDGGYSLGQKKT